MVAEVNENTEALQNSSPGSGEQSSVSSQQQARSADDRWSSNWLGDVCKSALSAVFKGWVRQEIVTQFKLAIPVVSVMGGITPIGALFIY